MPNLLTVSDAREHLETDVTDAVLQRLVDDADSAIARRHGPHSPGADDVIVEDVTGGDERLFLRRPAATVSSIVEHLSETTNRTLDPSDYRSEFEGRALLRLPNGTNPAARWGYRNVVTYAPTSSDNATRRRVIIDLVRLALQHNALAGETAGDYSSRSVDYQAEREKLIREVAASAGGMRVY